MSSGNWQQPCFFGISYVSALNSHLKMEEILEAKLEAMEDKMERKLARIEKKIANKVKKIEA